ncbi:hypothetical protein [Terrihabitans soli]|nr:hypothetical protein [Terrihabitans soli]
MNSETGIFVAVLAFLFGVLGAFARFVQRLSRLESRVETCEADGAKTEIVLAQLVGQMQAVSETLGAVRLYAAENYVPLERMAIVENKIDGLGQRSGAIEAKQAEQGATLEAIKDMVTDIRTSLARR